MVPDTIASVISVYASAVYKTAADIISTRVWSYIVSLVLIARDFSAHARGRLVWKIM